MVATSESGAKRRRGRGRARGRPRGRGRGRGRPRKAMVIESDDEVDEEQIETSETVDNMVEIPDETIYSDAINTSATTSSTETRSAESQAILPPSFDIDDDISHLVPPSFTTISKGPPQPMLELGWKQRYTPLGDRLPNPNIHMCDICRLPIRIYGRMIPCKHVFCYFCSHGHNGQCPRCAEKVHRIEKNHIGTLFMCIDGGNRYGYDGCRRTYLSHRDLQAHINLRHNQNRTNFATTQHRHHRHGFSNTHYERTRFN